MRQIGPQERVALVFGLAVDYQIFDTKTGAEYFHGSDPAPADSWEQTLTDNPPDCIHQPVTDLRLFILFKHAQDTVDCLAGVNGMQGG